MNERERIELIMKCYELSPSQFADKTGIQRASVSHILSGRNKASLEVMLKIYDAFPGLDMEWLMTGKGEEPGSANKPAVSTTSGGGSLFAEHVANTPALNFVAEETAHVPAEPLVDKKDVRKSDVQPAVSRERRTRKTMVRPSAVVNNDVQARRIREIRVYYTDGTYEILMPER